MSLLINLIIYFNLLHIINMNISIINIQSILIFLKFWIKSVKENESIKFKLNVY